MNSPGNILYKCTLLHIICKHLHDLYTLNSLSGREILLIPLYIFYSLWTGHLRFSIRRKVIDLKMTFEYMKDQDKVNQTA